MRRTRTIRQVAFAVAALTAALVVMPSVAHAGPVVGGADTNEDLKKSKDGPCTVMSNAVERSRICMYKSTTNKVVWGHVDYADALSRDSFIQAFLYVERCQAINNTPTNCGDPIMETSDSGWTSSTGRWGYDTPYREAKFGWIYHACASLHNYTTGFEYVNVCSPWITGNPEPAHIMIG